MNEADARKLHLQLGSEIRRHDRAYYQEARPEITDQEYDSLFRKLQDLERQFPFLVSPDSPTQRVAGAPSGKFNRVPHLLPMLSLDKVEASEHPGQETEPDRAKRSRLQDEKTLHGLNAFDTSIRKYLGCNQVAYVMEPKVDGVSVSLHYHHGRLALGATRGDGFAGDDITSNLRTLRSIPTQLELAHPPPLLEVRGEVYIATQDFDALNAGLSAAGEKPFPNARNAAAGALKLLDPRHVRERPLRAVFYAVGATDGISFTTHSEVLEFLAASGLPTQKIWWKARNMTEILRIYHDEVMAGYDEKHDLRTRLPYEIDGVVIKVNNMADWPRIPGRSRAPGHAIVHKPVPWITPAETLLRAITVQVGRTGVLTPVAELEPVFVQGSTITRATLHNEDEIRRKDIRIGDTVVIRKAGMVIPEVVEVIKARRPEETREFVLSEFVGGKCPACGGPIARESIAGQDTEEVAWRCQNAFTCPAQLTRRLEYFCQRKALDIESLGGVVAEKLVEGGWVRDPLDLFDLNLQTLAGLNLGSELEPRILGEKNASKIMEALQRAKTAPLHRWIYSLAIPDIGEATAKQLAATHENLESLAQSPVLKDIRQLAILEKERAETSPRSRRNPPKNEQERTKREEKETRLKEEIDLVDARLAREGLKRRLNEVGPVASASVLDYFASAHGQKTLDRLHQLGVSPENSSFKPTQSSYPGSNPNQTPFAGKVFVLTGTLPTLSREAATARIESSGGRVTGSVSKKTDFVLAGAEAGSKLQKAMELGIPILNEEEFLQRLEQPGPPS